MSDLIHIDLENIGQFKSYPKHLPVTVQCHLCKAVFKTVSNTVDKCPNGHESHLFAIRLETSQQELEFAS